MASPFTVVKGDEFTRLTPTGIIRCLQVQDPEANRLVVVRDRARREEQRSLVHVDPEPGWRD